MRTVIVVVAAFVAGLAGAWLYVVLHQAQFEPHLNSGDRVGAVLARQYDMDLAPARMEVDRYRGVYEEPSATLRSAVGRAWNGFDKDKSARDTRAKAEFDATYWMAAWFFVALFLLGGVLGLAVSSRDEGSSGG